MPKETEDEPEDEPEDEQVVYHKANRFLQIGLLLGIVIMILAQAGAIYFDYGLYAAVICVALGAGIRQIIVSRNT